MSELGVVEGRFVVIERLGGETCLYLQAGDASMTVVTDGDVVHRVHDQVRLGFDPLRAHLFDSEGRALPSLHRHPLAAMTRDQSRDSSTTAPDDR